jgi:hypothetical protein
VYDHVERASFREDGRPGLDVGMYVYGCTVVEGRFEVKALDISPGGVLRRLWIVYEQHCEGAPEALFGEVRVGAAGPVAATAMAPASVRWPITERARPPIPVPVQFVAPRDLQVAGVAVVGAGAASFAIERDDCSGAVLVAGGSCWVRVTFRPVESGTSAAVLRITDTAGGQHETTLEGFAYGGRTRMVVDNHPTDPYAEDRHWSYTPADARIVAGIGADSLHFGVLPEDRDAIDWHATFTPEPGGELTEGRTYWDTDPWDSDPWGDIHPMIATRGEQACSSATGFFTIRELVRDVDGKVRRASVEFEQDCSSSSWFLSGVFELRAGDTTATPSWMGPFSPGVTGPFRSAAAVHPAATPDEPWVDAEPPVGPDPPSSGSGTGQGQPESQAGAAAVPPAPGASQTVGPGIPTGGAESRLRRRPVFVDRRGRLRLWVACRSRPCTGVVRVRSRGAVVAARRFTTRSRRSRVVLQLDRRLTRRVLAGRALPVTVVVRFEGTVQRIRALLRQG